MYIYIYTCISIGTWSLWDQQGSRPKPAAMWMESNQVSSLLPETVTGEFVKLHEPLIQAYAILRVRRCENEHHITWSAYAPIPKP